MEINEYIGIRQLVKLFPTLIRQSFPPSKICAVQYTQKRPPLLKITVKLFQNLGYVLITRIFLGLFVLPTKIYFTKHQNKWHIRNEHPQYA